MSMKKFICLTSAALAATALTASAQVTVDVVNAYIFRGATINDEVNVQPGFGTTILGGAVNVGTWGNYNTDSSQFDEVDFFFGIPLPLGEESPIQAEVGYTEYMYPTGVTGDEETGVIDGGLEADREPYAKVTTSIEDINASLLLAYGIEGTPKDKFYSELGLDSTVGVAENLGLNLSTAVGYGEGAEETGFGFVSVGAKLIVTVLEDRDVSIGVKHFIETDDKVLEIDEDTLVTLSFAL